MSRIHVFITVLFSSLFLLFTQAVYAQDDNAQTTETTTTTAQTANGPVTVEKRVITTTVPAAKEVIATPTGYLSCDSISAGWDNDVWVPAHRVCKYQNSAEGVAWVDGYWSCTKYIVDSGECTKWEWIAAHWQKTYTVY